MVKSLESFEVGFQNRPSQWMRMGSRVAATRPKVKEESTMTGHAELRGNRKDDVLRALREMGPLSAADLVTLTGHSRPTVVSLLDDLEQAHWVERRLSEGGTPGRPASIWDVAPQAGIVMAVDALVDSVLVVAASVHGQVLEVQASHLDQKPSEARLDAILALVEQVRRRAEPIGGPLLNLAVSTTGIVDGDGVILRSDLVPQWRGLGLAEIVSERTGVPTSVGNDINLAAWGEFCLRRDTGRLSPGADMLLVRMTRGLHTGLVLGGALHYGRQWNAGEVSDVLDLHLQPDEDPDEEWIDRAALTAGSVAAVIDPDLIVMSGPTSKSVNVLRRVIARLVAQRPIGSPVVSAEVDSLGGAASVAGALYVALDRACVALLGVQRPHPVVLRGHERISSEIERRGHTIMTEGLLSKSRERIRVGVVGVGARAALALNAERNGNDGIITAVCEPHHLARERVSQRLGKNPDEVSISAEVGGLIKAGVDVAFVTSPDDTHAEITCQLLEAGIPVYLEKPLAITLESATRVLTTAYETGTKLYVGHNMRHMNVVRSMRELIRAGRIGEVKAVWCRHFVGSGGDFYFKDWHATREHGTGLLLQKAAHDIDVMHWFADSHTDEVVGMGALTLYDQITDRADHSDELMGDWYSVYNWPPLSQKGLNSVIDVEDLSMMLMHMESGVLASYQQCHYTPDYWRNYTVIGTEGRIENFGDGEGGIIRLWNRRTTYNAEGDESFPIVGDAHGHADADVLTVTEFFNFVREGVVTDTSPLGAWYAVAAGIEATESLRTGCRPRRVPDLTPEVVDYFNNNQVK